MEKSSNSITYMFSGTFPQVLAAIAGTLSSISDGMHYGWTAPVIPILNSKDSPIKISKNNESWLETTYMIGGIAGLPVIIILVDRIGRKNLTISASCVSLLSWILIAVSPNVHWLYAARFLSGLAGDVAFVAVPMYVAEIAEQKIRGLLASMIYLMMLVGILFIYAIAPFTPFYGPSIVGCLLLVIQFGLFTCMPQSPYYLLTKNRKDDARKCLSKLRTTGNLEEELDEISRAIERQKKEKGRPQDLILVRSNRKAVVVLTVLNLAQHFGGITVILMNMHTILTEADSAYLSSSTTAILFSVLMLIAASISSLTVDKYGRKFLLVTSGVLTGLCLLTLGIYFNLKHSGYDLKTVSWIPVTCVMFYAIAFKVGLGIVPVVLSAELFSNKVKAMGMTVAETMYLFCALISVEVYEYFVTSYGYHAAFYLFAVLCFLAAIFCIFGFPETKGKTLEEIQFLLKGKARGTTKINDTPV